MHLVCLKYFRECSVFTHSRGKKQSGRQQEMSDCSPSALHHTTRASKYFEGIPKAGTVLATNLNLQNLRKKRLPEREITKYPCFITNDINRKQLGEIGPS